MTLQSSGTITIGDLRTEFSGPTPSGLSDYYRGIGNIVPDHGPNAGIPTSGIIALSDFYDGTSDMIIRAGTSGGNRGWIDSGIDIGDWQPRDTFNGWDLDRLISDNFDTVIGCKPGIIPDTDPGAFTTFTLDGTFSGGAGTWTENRVNRVAYTPGGPGGTTFFRWNEDPIGRMIDGNDYTYDIS